MASAGQKELKQFEPAWPKAPAGYRPDGAVVNNIPGQPNNSRWTITQFTNVTINPPGVVVFEMCDKCAGHDHKLKRVAPAPAYTPEHVAPDNFGDRSGTYYNNSLFRGQEVRRVEIETVLPNGQVSPVPSIVNWEIRSINHRFTGIEWHGSIRPYPCQGGATLAAYHSSAEICNLVADAVYTSGLFEEHAVLDVSGALPRIIWLAGQSRRPSFVSVLRVMATESF
ncbi:MAG: hypothetical protein E6J14_12695 [Chloroflexi bacterium]|nr:MAG: hypothetical protein E6J14_12695 [Chloroflexota bacterium]